MSENNETETARTWGSRPASVIFTAEEFLVPPSLFRDEMTHAAVQEILNLIYAMLACGCDFETIKMRIMAL